MPRHEKIRRLYTQEGYDRIEWEPCSELEENLIRDFGMDYLKWVGITKRFRVACPLRRAAEMEAEQKEEKKTQ